ncbi:MAG: zinc-ribbon domain-containing protein [Lachnospiraceae bacterium]|nr:zinc-ribbon domain-containing protein [Lachnospiraceae bacterium]
MICSNCGKEIPDNHPFCMYCGTPLKDNAEPAYTEPAQDQPADSGYEAPAAENDGSYNYQNAESDGSYGTQGSGYNAPYAAPEQPAVNNYNVPVEAPAKQKKSGKGAMIVFLILAIIFLAGTGVFAFLFFTQKSDLDKAKAENAGYETTVEELKGKVDTLESEKSKLSSDYQNAQNDLTTARNELEIARGDYDSLRESYDDLQTDYDSISDELYNLYSQNGELGSDSYNFGLIRDFSSNNQYKDFYTNEDIVVMRPGDTFKIRIKLEHDGGIVYCEWTDGSVCSHEFGSWDVYDIPFTFTAKKAGVSYYTFTNSINNESFKVIVIVTDK